MEKLLREAARAALPVLHGIDEADLGKPTPCPDYTVEQLLNHLFQVVVNFQRLAAHQPTDWQAPADFVHGDWREHFTVEAEKLADAWGAPGALEGVTSPMGIPQPVLAQMALLDLTVHAWDLAAATGQPYHPAPGAIDSLNNLVDVMGDKAREMKAIGPPCQVPQGSSPMEQLLARTGRDPFAPIG